MSSLFSFLFGRGTSPDKNVLYKGSYNGETYTIRVHETRAFNGSRTDWRIKLGNLPEVPINITRRRGTPIPPGGAVSTDWGVPYSDEVFAGHELIYFADRPTYSSSGDDYSREMEPQHDQTLLYVSRRLSTAQFRTYAEMMTARWKEVDLALTKDDNNFPHLIGLVHAERPLFIRTFRGICNGAPHVLRVDPDGYVNFGVDDAEASSNHVRHCKVQMPGKVIVLSALYLWRDYQTTKAQVATFKDENGESIESAFELRD